MSKTERLRLVTPFQQLPELARKDVAQYILESYDHGDLVTYYLNTLSAAELARLTDDVKFAHSESGDFHNIPILELYWEPVKS
jgi:hypothetical protein